MSRGRWRRSNQTLDPQGDFLQIYRQVLLYEFPWDMTQALRFALFRTYAVPGIGGLLARTGEFEQRTQKRYDDTVLLLEKPAEVGFDHPQARAAIARMNQMHRGYDIANDDLRYVLATIVVSPVRWIARYGKRPLIPNEVAALVRFGRELGRRMGIKDIPPDYEQFAALMDRYEAERFARSAGARVARSTLDLLCSYYPAVARPVVETVSRALMDPPLLEALDLQDPGPWVRVLVQAGLRLRARLLRMSPDRTAPLLPRQIAGIRSYPAGFDVALLGTFPAGRAPRVRPGADPLGGPADESPEPA